MIFQPSLNSSSTKPASSTPQFPMNYENNTSTCSIESANNHSGPQIPPSLSILHNGDGALPIGNLFDSQPGVPYAQIGITTLPWTNNECGQTPTDGGKNFVWFCHNCGDGPICWWQTQCVICGHVRCSICTVEETS
ncbi:hypothetical protein GQ44DRAFT_217545 [Phaeosphaeriaceae sp. PMI808]|nr:hypothetical protein GQ44DRAFT_217545 [Phaeosphaeriaceae sp. PMI808]